MAWKKLKSSNLVVFITTFLALVALVIFAFAVLFSASRWWTANDEADIQGTWSIEKSSTKITISDKEIRMSDDVIFTYTIDTSAKSITEKLANKTGKVHYVFSKDKNEVVLIDQDLDFFTSTFLDAGDLIKTFFSGGYSDSSAGFLNSDIADDSVVRLKRD